MYRKAITKKKSFGKSSITLKTIKKRNVQKMNGKNICCGSVFFFLTLLKRICNFNNFLSQSIQ